MVKEIEKMIVNNNFSEVYLELISTVNFYGSQSKLYENGSINRKRQTFYLENQLFQLTDIENNLVYIPNRQFSLVHAVTEFVMLFSDKDELRYYNRYNKNINKFSDNGSTLRGNYSKRIFSYDGFQKVVDTLKKDMGSRQAVLTIFDSSKDLLVDSKDIPCTLSLTFSVTDNFLNMSVHMRSNDLVWGLPYDVFVFTNLQKVIANSLDLNFGKYTHYVDNLHYYEDKVKEVTNIIDTKDKHVDLNYFVYEDLNEMQRLAKHFTDFVDKNKIDDLMISHLRLFACEEFFKRGIAIPRSILKSMMNCNFSTVFFTKRYKWGDILNG